RRCYTHDAHEGPRRDTHTGEIRRDGCGSINRPFHQKLRRKKVTQKSKAWDDRGESKRLGSDVNDLHFEEIARLCSIDEDWPGQGVDEIEINATQVSYRRRRCNDAIERITCL